MPQITHWLAPDPAFAHDQLYFAVGDKPVQNSVNSLTVPMLPLPICTL